MDVKKSKEQSVPAKQKTISRQQATHKYWIGGYAFLAIIFITAYFLLRLKTFQLFGNYLLLIQKICLGAFFGCLTLIAGRIIEMVTIKHSHVKAVRYNLVRVIRLMTVLFIIIIFISFLFQNWYTAAVSLGLISLILGFALQTPISSFIAWLYIIFRNPYRVGDRIQLNQFTGDVVEIGYLDTTLWEFGGDYLTNDLPSGRLIRFPNSLVLQNAVFNYSWPKFPYIWNEIPFHVAYESDFNFIQKTLQRVTKNELGPETPDRIQHLKELIKETPIDELEVKEYPYVSFRINANTWVEVTVTYLVEPKKASSTRTGIIKKAVEELLKEPGKVLFPKSNSR